MPRSGPYRRHVGELRLATVLAVPDIPRHSRYGCCTFEIACCCTKHHSGEKKESAESATTGAGRVRSASCAKASARLNRARIIREGGANVATNVERNACLRRENMAPLRPLIIDATAKAKAARVLAHAEKNHYRPGPGIPPPGDDERFVPRRGRLEARPSPAYRLSSSLRRAGNGGRSRSSCSCSTRPRRFTAVQAARNLSPF